jgi:hypothetical protein
MLYKQEGLGAITPIYKEMFSRGVSYKEFNYPLAR